MQLRTDLHSFSVEKVAAAASRTSCATGPVAVDLGTGTGLLAILAAKAGASVTAFEVVEELAALWPACCGQLS